MWLRGSIIPDPIIIVWCIHYTFRTHTVYDANSCCEVTVCHVYIGYYGDWKLIKPLYKCGVKGKRQLNNMSCV